MGEFVEQEREYRGRPYFKQRDTEGNAEIFLYFEGDSWWVNNKFGERHGGLRNNRTSSRPPTYGWLYGDGKGWNNNDTSFTVYNFASPLCNAMKVTGKGGVVEKHSRSLGIYWSVSSVQEEIQKNQEKIQNNSRKNNKKKSEKCLKELRNSGVIDIMQSQVEPFKDITIPNFDIALT